MSKSYTKTRSGFCANFSAAKANISTYAGSHARANTHAHTGARAAISAASPVSTRANPNTYSGNHVRANNKAHAIAFSPSTQSVFAAASNGPSSRRAHTRGVPDSPEYSAITAAVIDPALRTTASPASPAPTASTAPTPSTAV